MNWKTIDKILKNYLKKYKNKQFELKDNIQAIFDLGITDLGKIVNKTDLSRFKRYLENSKDLVKKNDYVAYLIKKYINRSRISYKDLLNIMILTEYAKFETDIYENQIDTFENISQSVYVDTKKQCEKYGFKSDGWKWHDAAVLAYLLLPNEKGLLYLEQVNSVTIYNAGQIYKQASIDISQGKIPNVNNEIYTNIFDKQRRAEINIKKDDNQKDKFSGYIDNQSTFLINQLKKEIFEHYDVKYCKFMSIHDSRRTKMCASLDGQIFKVNELNVYSRYSAMDGRDVTYRTVGMVVGENLPPILNSFHYCRSWIEPTRGIDEK